MKTLMFNIFAALFLFPHLLFAQTEQASRVIVLCDVSSSITGKVDKNQPQIKIMKEKCKAILRHYPANSDLSFYIITRNVAITPFLQYTPSVIKLTNQAYELKRLRSIDTLIDKAIDNAVAHDEGQTCILSSVENAFLTFNVESAQQPGFKNELIIFSDMMEQCNVSPLGKVWMNNKGGPVLNTQQQGLVAKYTPRADRKNRNVFITLFNTSPNMDSQFRDSILDVWTSLFSKLGSPQAINHQLYFLSTLEFKPRKELRRY